MTSSWAYSDPALSRSYCVVLEPSPVGLQESDSRFANQESPAPPFAGLGNKSIFDGESSDNQYSKDAKSTNVSPADIKLR